MIQTLVVLFCLVQSTHALGHSIRSTSSMGFALEKDSEFAGDSMSGSIAYFSMTTPLSSQLEIGLQSIASGGSNDDFARFYRLASGVLLGAEIPWLSGRIQAFIGTYQQTLEYPQRGFKARGIHLQLTYAREFIVNKIFSWGWSSFVSKIEGRKSFINTSSPSAHFSQASGVAFNLNFKI